MDIEAIRTYCMSMRGVTEDCAFGEDVVLFRLCGKIFACIDLERPDRVVVKTSEEQAVYLRAHYQGIQEAWHWNKRYWSEVLLEADVPDTVVRTLLDGSYEIIRFALPKKTLYNFRDMPEDWSFEHYPVLDSAMNVLRHFKQNHHETGFQMVSTDYQTAGRGQGTNTWESEAGKNLLFAFRYHPVKVKAVDQFSLLQCVSVAVALALEKYLGRNVTIKWPNDIYCGDRKICGILIEHDVCGEFLSETRCGIGINVNQATFSGSVPNPVSLRQLLGKEVDRAAVLRNFIRQFVELNDILQREGGGKADFMYLGRLYRGGSWCLFRSADGEFEAYIEGVSKDGRLMLFDRESRHLYYAHKEVEFVLPRLENIGKMAEKNGNGGENE